MFNYTKIAVLLVLILQAVIGIDFEYVLTDNKVQCFGDALGKQIIKHLKKKFRIFVW